MMSRFVFKILEQSSEFTIPGCELLFVDKKYGTQICALFRVAHSNPRCIKKAPKTKCRSKPALPLLLTC